MASQVCGLHFQVQGYHWKPVDDRGTPPVEWSSNQFCASNMRTQFPRCNGLKNTLLQNQVRLTIANKIVQIHNNHWVVISNVRCSGNDLTMYDTIYDDICTSAMALVRSVFKQNVKCQHCAISTEAGGRCGSWFIQYCHCHFIVTWLSPGLHKQSLLQPHLISCFANKAMPPFP